MSAAVGVRYVTVNLCLGRGRGCSIPRSRSCSRKCRLSRLSKYMRAMWADLLVSWEPGREGLRSARLSSLEAIVSYGIVREVRESKNSLQAQKVYAA